MRILYFSRDYTPHDHRFLSALSKTGHQVIFQRLERQSHQLEERPLPEGVREIAWAGGKAPVSWRDGLRLLPDLNRVIRQERPELIQAGPVQRSALLVALAGYHPLVSTSWGYDLLKDAERSPVWRLATRYTLAKSDVLVGDCATIRRRAIEYGMRPDRIITFPWGIDLQHFNPTGRILPGQDEGTFSLLSTRSWEPIYGVDLIARAFAIVARNLPELRLVMLGNGSQAAVLKEIFIKAGVLNQVYFPGQVGYATLPRHYRSADLYISASHSDGTSISLLEALACGCPVLLSDIPGNQEWVTPDEQGWLFQDGDVDGLAEGILRAYRARRDLPEIGCASRRLAESRADWERNFPHLLEAYQLALVSSLHDVH